MKFKTTSDKKTSNKESKMKQHSNVGMLFMRTKLVFVLLTKYYQLSHAFLDEIDTSLYGILRSYIRLEQPEHPGIPGSYKQGLRVFLTVERIFSAKGFIAE